MVEKLEFNFSLVDFLTNSSISDLSDYLASNYADMMAGSALKKEKSKEHSRRARFRVQFEDEIVRILLSLECRLDFRVQMILISIGKT